MAVFGKRKQLSVLALFVLLRVLAASAEADASPTTLVERDHPPGQVGGPPLFAPRPTDNPEDPCWHFRRMRLSCMFRVVPTPTPTISTVWIQPAPMVTFTPTIFNPNPAKTATVKFQPPVTVSVTVTVDPEPSVSWTEKATWTEHITWTETVRDALARAVPTSGMTKNGRRAVKSEIGAEAEPIFTTVAKLETMAEAEPIFTTVAEPGTLIEAEPIFNTVAELETTAEAEPIFATVAKAETTAKAEPIFTTVAKPEVAPALVARRVDETCRTACVWDPNRPECEESCNQDLVSFTVAMCKDYAPSCMADKGCRQCKADCDSLVPGDNVCAAGCALANDVEQCEASCDRDLDAFGTAICREHTEICREDADGLRCERSCSGRHKHEMEKRDEARMFGAIPENEVIGAGESEDEEKNENEIKPGRFPPWGDWSCFLGWLYKPECHGDDDPFTST